MNRQELVDNVADGKTLLQVWYGPNMAAARRRLTAGRPFESVICDQCDLLYERPEYSAQGFKRLLQDRLRASAPPIG